MPAGTRVPGDPLRHFAGRPGPLGRYDRNWRSLGRAGRQPLRRRIVTLRVPGRKGRCRSRATNLARTGRTTMGRWRGSNPPGRKRRHHHREQCARPQQRAAAMVARRGWTRAPRGCSRRRAWRLSASAPWTPFFGLRAAAGRAPGARACQLDDQGTSTGSRSTGFRGHRAGLPAQALISPGRGQRRGRRHRARAPDQTTERSSPPGCCTRCSDGLRRGIVTLQYWRQPGPFALALERI